MSATEALVRRRQRPQDAQDGAGQPSATRPALQPEAPPCSSSAKTIAVVTAGLALAGLDITSGNSIRSEMQAMCAEARADREAWQAEARALRAEAGADREALGRLTGVVEEVRTTRR